MAEPSIAADELRIFIERIERLEEERDSLNADVRDIYAEARARGYDPVTMRKVVRLRRLEKFEREESEAMLDTYKKALGVG